MRRIIASVIAAGMLALGGLAAASLGGTTLVSAQTAPDGGSGGATTEHADGRRPLHVLDAVLDELVEQGVITPEQADTIRERVAEKLRERRHDRHDRPFRFVANALQVSADTIGISVEDLTAALREGSSVADVAEANGVDPATVVEAIVDAGTEAVNRAVADGRLTQEQADRILEALPERAERFVHATRHDRPGPPRPLPPRGDAPVEG